MADLFAVYALSVIQPWPSGGCQPLAPSSGS